MEYTSLGNTGSTVSRLGFGGAPAGLKDYLDTYDPDERTDREQVVAALGRALELGVTYFDSAPGYGDGAGEQIFGEGLEGCGDEVYVATKVSMGEPDDVRPSIERSLERLRRERLDLVQIHGGSYSREQVDRILATGGIADALETARAEGLIRFLGFTTEDTNDSTYRLIRSGRFDVMQILYNLFFQHPYEASRRFGSLVEADNAGMGVVTMRSVTSGTFQRWMSMVHPENRFDYGPSLLQFVLSNPLVDVALVGMRDEKLVDANVRIVDDVDRRISLEELFRRYVT